MPASFYTPDPSIPGVVPREVLIVVGHFFGETVDFVLDPFKVRQLLLGDLGDKNPSLPGREVLGCPLQELPEVFLAEAFLFRKNPANSLSFSQR